MQTRPTSGSTPDPMSDANLIDAIAVDVISSGLVRGGSKRDDDLKRVFGRAATAAVKSDLIKAMNGVLYTETGKPAAQ